MKLSQELLAELTTNCRNWDTSELFQLIDELIITDCWKITFSKEIDQTAIYYEVDAKLFQGQVLITLNFMDLFKIYYIKDDKVVEIKNDVYLDDLLMSIDEKLVQGAPYFF
ncbi:hypothetical protein [Tenacibaculum agarivorans]|uniref:hypothetical protein n=1 Tax=Tenacibaculum agarivorans TaxID=1908389 RepID=UPI00094BAF66|nr:hypothetical protein [Tenacibaculum agarivorans]